MSLDPSKLVFTGFSAGGMMTWTIACGMAERFAGFIPMSGTFWAPVPPDCTAPPTNIVHIHGTQDGVVPLSGRAIGATRQGDVDQALAMYGRHGGFGESQASYTVSDMTCTPRGNGGGNILELCLFDGGHGFSTQRLRHGYERVMAGS